MATRLAQGRHTMEEEARAEVDVLNSRLEKTAQLTKRIQASLAKLEASGKSVRDVSTPLNSETRRLQTVGTSESRLLLSDSFYYLVYGFVDFADGKSQMLKQSSWQSVAFDNPLMLRTTRSKQSE